MISVRFEGGKELADALGGLSARVSKRLQYEALEEAAAPMVKAAGSMAPRRAPAPDLADNIITSRIAQRTDAFGDKSAASVAWGPAKAFFYGYYQEWGTVRHAAHPFMRPAFDQNAAKSLAIIGASLWRELSARNISRPAQTSGAPITGGPGGDGTL